MYFLFLLGVQEGVLVMIFIPLVCLNREGFTFVRRELGSVHEHNGLLFKEERLRKWGGFGKEDFGDGRVTIVIRDIDVEEDG